MEPEITALIIVAMLIAGGLLALAIIPRGAKVEVDARRRRFAIDNTGSDARQKRTRTRRKTVEAIEPNDPETDR
jgi:hypothetical protein